MPEAAAATPRVSVVMSVYNDVDRVAHAAQSILGQQFRALELIVINDGSTDASGAVLDRLAMADLRLRIIHQENAGLTKALIRGCNEARGEFIARQDSDDWSHPSRIGEQVDLLDSDERIGFVSCAAEYVGPGDEHLTYICRPTDPETATHGLLEKRQGPPAHGSVMFRKSLYEQVGGYRAEFHYGQDSDLWLRMGERKLIGYVAEVRYRHRKDAHSISGARRLQQSEFARLTHACRKARLAERTESVELQAAKALTEEILTQRTVAAVQSRSGTAQISYLIGSQLVSNGDSRARRYLWPVIKNQPLHWRAWVRLLQSWIGDSH